MQKTVPFLGPPCMYAAVVADPPCTECLPRVLKEFKHARQEKCVTCDWKCKREIFRKVMQNVAEADANVGKALREEFLTAADGSDVPRVTPANIFFAFICRSIPLYPNEEKMQAFYEAFMKKYPSLAVVLYKNFKSFIVPALRR